MVFDPPPPPPYRHKNYEGVLLCPFDINLSGKNQV